MADPELESAPLRGAEDRRIDNGWPSVDGELGVSNDAAVKQVKLFFYAGFFLLPWLWFVNCYYFSPIFRQSHQLHHIRHYVLWSAVGCIIYSVLLLMWALSFSIGGDELFGRTWKMLAVYSIADRFESMN